MRRSRTKVVVCLLAVLILGHLAPGRAAEGLKRSKRLWWASVAVVVAASVLDVASSRGGAETNPLLRGQNGTFNTGRALLLKTIMNRRDAGIEAWVMRRSPSSGRSAAAVNFVAAGGVAGLAVRNWKVAPAAQ